jgi:hypothetical protein
MGGGGIWEDMCYERPRAEACVATHHALVNAGEREIVVKLSVCVYVYAAGPCVCVCVRLLRVCSIITTALRVK